DLSATDAALRVTRLSNPLTDIATPRNGMIAYDSTDDELQGYVNGTWVDLVGATVSDIWVNETGDSMSGTLRMAQLTDPIITFTPDGADSNFAIGVQDNNDGVNNDYFVISQGDTLGASPRLVITTAGEIGINTDTFNSGNVLRVVGPGSTPVAPIGAHQLLVQDGVGGGSSVSIGLREDSTSTELAFGAANSGGGVGNIGSYSNHPINLITFNIERMTIDTSGNIGIGTTTPDANVLLDLSATDRALRVTRLSNPSTDIATPRNGMIAYDSTDNELQAYVNGSWVMLAEGGMIDISDDTNLTAGFGITITGDTVSVQDIYVQTAGDSMTGSLQFVGVGSDITTGAGEDLALMPASGRVGIGTTAPALGTILDLSATDAALRVTRLSNPVTDIATPRNGMIAYDSTDDELQAYVNGSWVMLAAGGMIDISDDTNLTAGTGITITGDTVSVQDIYVQTAGDSMTGSLQFVGVGSDITTGAGEDLALMPASGRVGVGTTAPALGTILDLSATDAALRVTRLSNPLTDIATPRNGMIAYDSTDNELQAYINGTWSVLAESGMIDISDDTNLTAGFGITITGDTVSVQDIYVQTAGDSMTGSLQFVGVGSDITTGAGEDLALMPASGRVGIGTIAPAAGTILDLSATDAALRVTRLSNPSVDIATPRNGMIAYDSTDNELMAYVNGSWVMLAEGGMIDISDDTNLMAGTGIAITGDTISVQDIYVLTAGDSMSGTLQMAATTDPTITFTPSMADSDFWIGVQDDNGNDNDDSFQIGAGSVPGTNAFFTITTTGTIHVSGTLTIEALVGNSGGITPGTNVPIPLIQQKDITLLEPDQIRSVNTRIPMFTVDTYNYPRGIEITAVRIITSTNATYQVDVEEWTDPDIGTGTETTIINIQSHNGGPADNENTETTAGLSSTTVSSGSYVMLELNDAEDIDWVKLTVYYYVRE
ncbi:MAG: hypothetical protein AB7F70_05940, partial [Candidatus Omnitrophota bacterium]